MLKEIGGSILKDSIGVLSKEKQFFTLDAGARKKVIEASLPGYPECLVDYLTSSKEEDFLSDMKFSIQVFAGMTTAAKNDLLSAIATYISVVVGPKLDELNSDFFFKDYQLRKEALKDLFPGTSILDSTIRSIFIESTYQEISSSAFAAIDGLVNIPTVVVQSPVELSAEYRKNIREYFINKESFSFIEFQINPQIIGGMRVFIDGKVVDNSWLAKIQAITSITS